MRRKVSEVNKYVPPLSRMFEQHKSWLIFLTCEKWTRMGGGRWMTEMINMDRDLILLSSVLSEGSEVDDVKFGWAEGVCHEIAGCSGGHRSGQEAQSSPGHPLFGPRYEYSTCNHSAIGETSLDLVSQFFHVITDEFDDGEFRSPCGSYRLLSDSLCIQNIQKYLFDIFYWLTTAKEVNGFFIYFWWKY